MCEKLLDQLKIEEKNHDYEKITKIINEILTKKPELKKKLLYKKAMAEINIKNYEDAINSLKEYFDLCKNEEERYLLCNIISDCYGKLNDIENEEKYLIKSYNEKQNEFSRKQLIYFYYLNKMFDKCIEFIKDLHDKNQADIEDLTNITYCYNNLNQPEKAIEYAEEILKIDSENVDMYITLTMAYEQLDNKEKLKETYEKIIALDSVEDEQLLLIKAQAYMGLGDDEKAIAYVDKTIKNTPYNPMTYIMKGMLYQKMNKYPEALECFKEAEKLDSDLVLTILKERNK